ncbi:MAG: DNA mismatch repair endonuclease MutL [Lachnospiraceae bacterium]|nr:DNA mismatch repair endonuclease MutL [Lachnospiraceae bacterium]
MSSIVVLDKKTIDKIAAGEVVERPLSVVKELVENSCDAGASHISVEIKGGGSELIRVTDDGGGIDAEDIKNAFVSHATSKLHSIDELGSIRSMGFRGEALSSIAAVSRTEIITRTKRSVTGVHFALEGGEERIFEEVGVPEGTTLIVRNLFFNTPARKKFLRTNNTEGTYISSLMEQLALSRPDIAFKYTVNGRLVLNTRGNGDLKEVIYRIYGKEFSDNLLELGADDGEYSLKGYIARPVVARKNRQMEHYFVNSRYVEDKVLSRAIEEGYSGFLMQHCFPFTVLKLSLPPSSVDVNVHPRKMEVRFNEEKEVFEFVSKAVSRTLGSAELINKVQLVRDEPPAERQEQGSASVPEPFEKSRLRAQEPVYAKSPERALGEEYGSVNERALLQGGYEESVSVAEPESFGTLFASDTTNEEQLDFFEEKILSRKAADEFRIVGQVFGTYWIIEYKKDMLIIDQHAAHEKVKYERLMKALKENTINSQRIEPPLIITLNSKQRLTIEEFMEGFNSFGFEIDDFGGSDIAIRAIPADLYGLDEMEVFTSMLDELGDKGSYENVTAIHDRIATMSCKAAVKGNTLLSVREAEELIEELLTLDNPYNCPHGRPTIIKLSERELEKKFKRIV